MADQFSGAALSMPNDMNNAFKSEKESLTLVDHNFALKNIEKQLRVEEH